MPNYIFHCPVCDYTEEKHLPIAERDGQVCLACSMRCNRPVPAERLPAAPGVSIKGFNAKNGYA